MSDTTETQEEPAASSGKKGLIIGLIAALILGGGGFYATFSGLIGGGEKTEVHEEPVVETTDSQGRDIAFIALDPMVISLGKGATNKYLRFGAQLEVPKTYEEEVQLLLPRVLDVLNGYLRAVEARDIENPSSMGRLRAQMLRRVQVVTGEGRILDLLVTEFVLN